MVIQRVSYVRQCKGMQPIVGMIPSGSLPLAPVLTRSPLRGGFVMTPADPRSATFQNWDGTPSGGILTFVSPERTVVRLEGEIDMSMSAEFGQLLLSLPAVTTELVLDVAGLTFCDCTLATFVAAMLEHMPVTVTPSNRWVVEFLRLVKLADRVRVAGSTS